MEKKVVFTDEALIVKIEACQKEGETFNDTVQRLCSERLNVYGGSFIVEEK